MVKTKTAEMLTKMNVASMEMQDALNSRDKEAIKAAAQEMELIEAILDEAESCTEVQKS